MSTGKRLAKRSILGTRVMVPNTEGVYMPGIIQAMTMSADRVSENRYSIRIEDGGLKRELAESEIVGPGFGSVSSLQLRPGQIVYVTHCNREMQGKIVRHDFQSQDVLINLTEDETVLKKIDEVRLLESRKSARLVNSDTDFSKLADINISANDLKKKQRAATAAIAIDVPRSDYVQIAGSRKRRTSEHLPDDEETMSQCTAAMVLMKLSCSPHSPAVFSPRSFDSSEASSLRSATPSPPLSSTTDEGIEMESERKQVIYQCTYPGCRERDSSLKGIESHVRSEHLNPEQLDDGEEEFYYTEIEVESTVTAESLPAPLSPAQSSLAALSLVDHLDMARPAHEDPGLSPRPRASSLLLSKSAPTTAMQPITIAPSPTGSSGKYILISPKSDASSSLIKSPSRRTRDGKKCRKVYGLEQRDLWCTQCKWKKACSRFHASEPASTIVTPAARGFVANPTNWKALKL